MRQISDLSADNSQCDVTDYGSCDDILEMINFVIWISQDGPDDLEFESERNFCVPFN